MNREPIHVISLGAGVQSSTMALMAAHGEITPMPVAAIFADTGDEPASVYRWLEWLAMELPFPVNRVWKQKAGQRQRLSVDGNHIVPYFTRDESGKKGILNRGCTRDYKIRPLRQAQRILASVSRGERNTRVVSWLGISVDEITRMKDSTEGWVENRYPLIEQRMTRSDCLLWMQQRGYPRPPRSACVFCPFHNDAEWRRLELEEPDEFKRAVEFEKLIQSRTDNGLKTTPFLHSSLLPLDQVDFRSLEERGQLNFFQNECEGMCGV